MSVHYDRPRGTLRRPLARGRHGSAAERFATRRRASASRRRVDAPTAGRSTSHDSQARAPVGGGVYALRDRDGTALAVRRSASPTARCRRAAASRAAAPRRPRGARPSRRSDRGEVARRATRSASSGRSCSRRSAAVRHRRHAAGLRRRTAASGCCRAFGDAAARGDRRGPRARLARARWPSSSTRGELSAKTVNNARTCLSMTLGEAVRRGLISRKPVRGTCPRCRSSGPSSTTCASTRSSRYLDACVDVLPRRWPSS